MKEKVLLVLMIIVVVAIVSYVQYLDFKMKYTILGKEYLLVFIVSIIATIAFVIWTLKQNKNNRL